MAERVCRACGKSLAGRRANATVCDDICRARARRGQTPDSSEATADGPATTRLNVLLSERGLTEDVNAGIALDLAKQLDSGVGRAAEARELRLVIAELTQKAPAASPADEVGQRRMAKLAGA